jgi:hypothetical protein
MKLLLVCITAVIMAGALTFTSCKSSGGPSVFCDTTACNGDTIRFSGDSQYKPFLTIGMKACNPDSMTWGHDQMMTRTVKFTELTEEDVKVNAKFIRGYVHDTSYVWVLFNECINGQGYAFKIPFKQGISIFRKNSAINSLDPKYAVDESLVAYTDRGNIFVEDMKTGKQATMTFGKRTELDYNKMHEVLDSVNITPTKVWAKVKIEGEWKELSKDIVLE